jgi:SAM-dependent methyltransferase
MTDQTKAPDGIDVTKVMAEIAAGVRRRYEAGEYPPEITAELDAEYAAAPLGRFERDLRTLKSLPFTADVDVASRKRGVAPVVSGVKRTIRGSLRWYANGLLGQVGTLARLCAGALEALGERVQSAERRLEELTDDVEAARREAFDAISHAERASTEAEALRASVESSTRQDGDLRVERLERAVRDLRETDERRPLTESAAPSSEVDSRLDYLSFEDKFRGDAASVAAKQRRYVELYGGANGRVLDVGCGRGEFLKLLAAEGIDAYGVDRHPDMVLECREQGLDVLEEDAIGHLTGLEPASLGGIFASQVLEHFEPVDVIGFFDLAAEKVAEGGAIVVETVNPQSLFVFANSLYLDLGHARPLHPQTLAFLAERAGLREVRVDYLSPPDEDTRLQGLPEVSDEELGPLVERLDENFRRIDALLFGPQDYALIARR